MLSRRLVAGLLLRIPTPTDPRHRHHQSHRLLGFSGAWWTCRGRESFSKYACRLTQLGDDTGFDQVLPSESGWAVTQSEPHGVTLSPNRLGSSIIVTI
jgi:hypothetical protein